MGARDMSLCERHGGVQRRNGYHKKIRRNRTQRDRPSLDTAAPTENTHVPLHMRSVTSPHPQGVGCCVPRSGAMVSVSEYAHQRTMMGCADEQDWVKLENATGVNGH